MCNNPTCKRNTFVSRCKKAVNAELLLTDKKGDTKITVILFNPIFVNVIEMNKEESETEDDSLSLKDYGITCNKEIIVTSIFNHNNA